MNASRRIGVGDLNENKSFEGSQLKTKGSHQVRGEKGNDRSRKKEAELRGFKPVTSVKGIWEYEGSRFQGGEKGEKVPEPKKLVLEKDERARLNSKESGILLQSQHKASKRGWGKIRTYPEPRLGVNDRKGGEFRGENI